MFGSDNQEKTIETQKKPKVDSRTFVQFRIRPEEIELLSNIAHMLHENKILKSANISLLAKSCLYTMVNQISVFS